MRTFFFFSSRRRHTRYWRDWSSDVCSSDLAADHEAGGDTVDKVLVVRHRPDVEQACGDLRVDRPQVREVRRGDPAPAQIGRASGRERVEISGVAVSLKKKYIWNCHVDYNCL